MILFGGSSDRPPGGLEPAAAAAAFFDEEAYLSSIKDQALAQETTVFATAHCPDHRFLLASSNQGRLAVWDLTSYLFPSINTTDGDDDDDEGYVDRPVLNPRGLRPPPRQLQPGQARLHPAALVKQGWPRLSLQVSDRAVNSIAFTSAGSGGKSSSSKSSKSSSSKTGGPSLLVLAGDEGIVVYEWAHFLALLQQDAPPGARTLDFPPPKARLCALPAGAARAWPYLTESNQVALAEGGGRGEAYSACGDAAVRCWDLEKGVCTRVLQGHTGYVHTVAPVPGGSGLVLSGGEDGVIRLWDPRASTQGGLAAASASSSSHDPWPSSSSSASASAMAGLQGGKWVAALAADPGGNFVVAGGGVERPPGLPNGGKHGFVAVFHLPSMALVASAATPASFVQDVCFLEDKIVSAGNEATVTHWTRPGLVPSARVTISDLPSVFAVNARAGPPQGDGVTVYAGRSDAVSVFINPENKAFDLKFR